MRLHSLRLAALGLLLVCVQAAAQYPARPVRLVVAFTAGGVTDIVARTLAPRLAGLWDQPVVVENRPGAGGALAATIVARAPADGSMLLVHSSGYAINAAITPQLPYDPRRDFVAVAPLASQPMLLVVHPGSGIHDVAGLIALAKAHPGEVTYGTAGIGSGAHFNAEKFAMAAGLQLVHVPYKGGAEAINDTVAGRLVFTFNTITLALPFIRDGRVRLIGVSAPERSRLLPEAPTIAEQGLPGFEFTFWNGLWAPAGTPAAVATKIAADLAQVVATPDVRERLASLGAEPMAMTPPQFARFVKSEIDSAERIARAAGIRTQ